MVATHRGVDDKESCRGIAFLHISDGEVLSALPPKADICSANGMSALAQKRTLSVAAGCLLCAKSGLMQCNEVS